MTRAQVGLIAGLAVLTGVPGALAQDMEPRAYSSSPVGTNFVVALAGASLGEILFDPSIPLIDVNADLRLTTLGYGRTFSLGDRQALVVIAAPYVWGNVEGSIQEEARSVRRSGFADVRLKTSIHLVGPGAMTVEEFRKAPRQTVMGMSLTVQAPTGEYNQEKLINLGTNRWAFKPEVGVSVPVGRWNLDAYAGVWLFTTNSHFFPGDTTRRQDPLVSLQAHVSYSFRNRAWLAFDSTWYGGGEATLDSEPPSARQNNTRIGGTFSFPLTARQSLKLVAATGASTRTGSDFDSYVAGWQFTWFDRSP